MKRKTGFTLAEVLITLSIIGVVAALTIPALLNNIQDAQYKTAWKNSFADINQINKKVLLDNVGSIRGVYNDGIELRNAYLNYMGYVKSCTNSIPQGCILNNYKFLNGKPIPAQDYPGAILNNGSIIYFKFLSKDCDSNDDWHLLNRCASMSIDINGNKGPNIQGKDLFSIILFENKILPSGCNVAPDCRDAWTPEISCIDGDTGDNNTGLGCAAKFLYQ